uniref:Ribonuclease Z n=1 Tax=Dichotomaria marginata TaxID=268567 RepID=A0A1G4NS13_9FLOR|nr:Ribonuclease Z [Dichotomaria marginata]SCW21461.1 Ribonuclease Z [Dichotomaria marginata]
MINNSLSFLIKCNLTTQVWLFNCPEGCQNTLVQNQIKIHQINNIILTSLEIDNISGIMGLLSSLSLSCRVQQVNIFGPPGIFQYLQLARKYSQTTFRYSLKIHIIHYGYLTINKHYLLYANPNDPYKHTFTYILLESEKIGRFQLYKAHNIYKLQAGPIYGQLKNHKRLIMPDGSIISGKYFTHQPTMGLKILYLKNLRAIRLSAEMLCKLTQLIYKNINEIYEL